MAQKYENDESGEINKFFNKVISKYKEHKDKTNLSFLYAFRSEVKMEGNTLIVGSVSKLSNRDRDLFEYDVRVEICEQTWNSLSNKEKLRVAYHELCHIKIEYTGAEGDDESGELGMNITGRIKTDKEGRVVFSIIDHDVIVAGFKAEYQIFGLNENDVTIMKALSKIRKKLKEKKKD